jgi:FG-GAP repeat
MRRVPILLFLTVTSSWAISAGWAHGFGSYGEPTGRSVFSDFNNDGFTDLVIGVVLEDVGGEADAGAVNVLYGSAAGLQATSPDDQFWHQDSPGVQDTAEFLDDFGSSLGAGDFNNDGFADLAIGVPSEDVGAVVAAGAVNVLYGSTGGLQATSPNDQFWHQDRQGVADTAEDGDRFGSSLGAGDFNNDGFADLAIGVAGVVSAEDVGTVVDAGAVNVLYGSAAGLQAISPNDEFWHQDSPGVADTAEDDDSFASSLGAGDFNNDGFADLAIGVAGLGGEDVGTVEDAGAVNVLYGSAAGLQATSPDDQLWHQDSPDVQDTAEDDDSFGFSLGAGDFNNDGFADLAIGVFFEDVGTVAGAGAVNVLFGSAAGLQAISPDDQFWHQDSPDVQDRAQNFDSFGSSLGAGDFNNDGFADLAIGVPNEDFTVFVGGAGAVNVLYGSAAGLQAISPDDQFWHQDSPDVQDTAEVSDSLASSLGAGDFNNDGFADLAMGVDAEDVGADTNVGAVSVLYGSAAGLQAISPDDQFWHQDSPEVQDRAQDFDFFGISLGAGDFNNDGSPIRP